MLDAVSVCIDERKKSRNKYLRGEVLFYAQRRGSVDVSAHRLHIKGCSFGRPSEQILRFAPLDLHKGKKYGWNVYFCCIKETGQPTVK